MEESFKGAERLTDHERELRDIQASLLRAQRGAQAGLWEVALPTLKMTWSPAYYELFGLPLTAEVSHDTWTERVHPEDRERADADFCRSIEHPGPHSFQFRIVRPDGAVRWVQWQGDVVRDDQGQPVRLSGITLDITERAQADASLRRREAQLQVEADALVRLNALSSRLWRTGSLQEGLGEMLAATIELVGADKGNVQLLDAQRGVLVIATQRGFEKDFLDFFREVSVEDDSACGRALRSGERIVIEDVEADEPYAPLRGVARAAGYRAVQSTPLITRDGAPLGMISTYYRSVHRPNEQDLRRLDLYMRQAADFIERCRTEDALRESEERLEVFANQLEQLVEERTQELAQSRDQLRALATDLNLAEQRERKRMAAELHDYLAQLLVLAKMKLGQGKRLADSLPACAEFIKQSEDALTEALDYTRTLVAELSPPVLHDFGLPTALRWLGEQMERHQLNVTISYSENHQVKLPEDQALLLFQSVRELLINSSKYSGTGEATLSLAQQNGHLRIEVRDQGKGFDADAAAAAAGDAVSSTRFGLFSIRERMKAMGGSFEIDSTSGKGTTARLTLPLGTGGEWRAASREQESRRFTDRSDHSPLTTHHSARSSTRIRVLLVDDHTMVRQGLRSVLDSYPDVEVVSEASNGEEAIDQVVKHEPAVVLMDINMPRMNGVEATARIKSRYPGIIVIGLSVQTGEEAQQAMLQAGAAMLLTKDAAVDQLYKTIQEALKTHMTL